jgi:excisionase family DNA binding protein
LQIARSYKAISRAAIPKWLETVAFSECQMNLPAKHSDKKPFASRSSNSRTLSVKQLAQFLGVSRHTIYRMRDNSELPPVLPIQKRVTRWRIEDIELWFELDCPNSKNFTRLKRDLKRFTRKHPK